MKSLFHKNMALAKAENRLVLVPYMIPGSPTAERYNACMQVLTKANVSLYETTLPVSGGWSEHTNMLIQELLQKSEYDFHCTLTDIQQHRPNMCVVYQGILQNQSFTSLVQQLKTKVDYIILEWQEPDEQPYQEICATHGIGFIRAIDPSCSRSPIAKILEQVESKAPLYLLGSQKTGGAMYDIALIRSTVRHIVKQRPDIYVLLGFGIKQPADIEKLRTVEGLSGAIVGTALLQASLAGITEFHSLLHRLLHACAH